MVERDTRSLRFKRVYCGPALEGIIARHAVERVREGATRREDILGILGPPAAED